MRSAPWLLLLCCAGAGAQDAGRLVSRTTEGNAVIETFRLALMEDALEYGRRAVRVGGPVVVEVRENIVVRVASKTGPLDMTRTLQQLERAFAAFGGVGERRLLAITLRGGLSAEVGTDQGSLHEAVATARAKAEEIWTQLTYHGPEPKLAEGRVEWCDPRHDAFVLSMDGMAFRVERSGDQVRLVQASTSREVDHMHYLLSQTERFSPRESEALDTVRQVVAEPVEAGGIGERASRRLGLAVLGMERITGSFVIDRPSGEPEDARFSGKRLRLDGLLIDRLRFPGPDQAERYARRGVLRGADAVIELRGSDLVVLRGPRATDMNLARAALAEAWDGDGDSVRRELVMVVTAQGGRARTGSMIGGATLLDRSSEADRARALGRLQDLLGQPSDGATDALGEAMGK